MRNRRVFVSGVLVSTALTLATAGCMERAGSGYPTTSYGYGNGYANQPHYYSQPIYQVRPTYYSAPPPMIVTQTRYVPVAVPAPRPNRWRDRNHDGIPDRYQQRWSPNP